MRNNLFVFALAVLILALGAHANMQCSIKTSCGNTEKGLFFLTGTIDAKISLAQAESYRLCCENSLLIHTNILVYNGPPAPSFIISNFGDISDFNSIADMFDEANFLTDAQIDSILNPTISPTIDGTAIDPIVLDSPSLVDGGLINPAPGDELLSGDITGGTGTATRLPTGGVVMKASKKELVQITARQVAVPTAIADEPVVSDAQAAAQEAEVIVQDACTTEQQGLDNCTDDTDCTSPTPYCNVNTQKCNSCAADSHCSVAQVCNSNVCMTRNCQTPSYSPELASSVTTADTHLLSVQKLRRSLAYTQTSGGYYDLFFESELGQTSCVTTSGNCPQFHSCILSLQSTSSSVVGSCGTYANSLCCKNCGTTELCNGLDDNCNNLADEGVENTILPDGNLCYRGATYDCSRESMCQTSGLNTCMFAGGQWVWGLTTNVPTEETRCDDIDDNCDGFIDDGCNDDGDAFCDGQMQFDRATRYCQAPDDCNDDKFMVNPALGEASPTLCSDGLDNDCNGRVDALDPICIEHKYCEDGTCGTVQRLTRIDLLNGLRPPPPTKVWCQVPIFEKTKLCEYLTLAEDVGLNTYKSYSCRIASLSLGENFGFITELICDAFSQGDFSVFPEGTDLSGQIAITPSGTQLSTNENGATATTSAGSTVRDDGDTFTIITSDGLEVFINDQGQVVVRDPTTGTETIVGPNDNFQTSDGGTIDVDPITGDVIYVQDETTKIILSADGSTVQIHEPNGTIVFMDARTDTITSENSNGTTTTLTPQGTTDNPLTTDNQNLPVDDPRLPGPGDVPEDQLNEVVATSGGVVVSETGDGETLSAETPDGTQTVSDGQGGVSGETSGGTNFGSEPGVPPAAITPEGTFVTADSTGTHATTQQGTQADATIQGSTAESVGGGSVLDLGDTAAIVTSDGTVITIDAQGQVILTIDGVAQVLPTGQTFTTSDGGIITAEADGTAEYVQDDEGTTFILSADGTRVTIVEPDGSQVTVDAANDTITITDKDGTVTTLTAGQAIIDEINNGTITLTKDSINIVDPDTTTTVINTLTGTVTITEPNGTVTVLNGDGTGTTGQGNVQEDFGATPANDPTVNPELAACLTLFNVCTFNDDGTLTASSPLPAPGESQAQATTRVQQSCEDMFVLCESNGDGTFTVDKLAEAQPLIEPCVVRRITTCTEPRPFIVVSGGETFCSCISHDSPTGTLSQSATNQFFQEIVALLNTGSTPTTDNLEFSPSEGLIHSGVCASNETKIDDTCVFDDIILDDELLETVQDHVTPSGDIVENLDETARLGTCDSGYTRIGISCVKNEFIQTIDITQANEIFFADDSIKGSIEQALLDCVTQYLTCSVLPSGEVVGMDAFEAFIPASSSTEDLQNAFDTCMLEYLVCGIASDGSLVVGQEPYEIFTTQESGSLNAAIRTCEILFRECIMLDEQNVLGTDARPVFEDEKSCATFFDVCLPSPIDATFIGLTEDASTQEQLDQGVDAADEKLLFVVCGEEGFNNLQKKCIGEEICRATTAQPGCAIDVTSGALFDVFLYLCENGACALDFQESILATTLGSLQCTEEGCEFEAGESAQDFEEEVAQEALVELQEQQTLLEQDATTGAPESAGTPTNSNLQGINAQGRTLPEQKPSVPNIGTSVAPGTVPQEEGFAFDEEFAQEESGGMSMIFLFFAFVVMISGSVYLGYNYYYKPKNQKALPTFGTSAPPIRRPIAPIQNAPLQKYMQTKSNIEHNRMTKKMESTFGPKSATLKKVEPLKKEPTKPSPKKEEPAKKKKKGDDPFDELDNL